MKTLNVFLLACILCVAGCNSSPTETEALKSKTTATLDSLLAEMRGLRDDYDSLVTVSERESKPYSLSLDSAFQNPAALNERDKRITNAWNLLVSLHDEQEKLRDSLIVLRDSTHNLIWTLPNIGVPDGSELAAEYLKHLKDDIAWKMVNIKNRKEVVDDEIRRGMEYFRTPEMVARYKNPA